MALTPVLTAHWDEPNSFEIENYKKHGGYEALKKSLKISADDVIKIVKDSFCPWIFTTILLFDHCITFFKEL